MEQHPSPSRRTVTRAAAAAALGVAGAGALAACGSSDPAPAASTPAAAPTSGAASPTGSATTSASASASPSESRVEEAALAALDDVPVGQAISIEATSGTLILSRTAADTVVAFSAKCPHAACAVAVRGSSLVCPCHGSTFELATGKVLRGPAKADLTTVPVTVQGTSILPG